MDERFIKYVEKFKEHVRPMFSEMETEEMCILLCGELRAYLEAFKLDRIKELEGDENG